MTKTTFAAWYKRQRQELIECAANSDARVTKYQPGHRTIAPQGVDKLGKLTK
jgi:hypothetical protein